MAAKKIPRRVGLARALSKLGYCSRSEAAELVRKGRVRLNGTVRHDPETPVRLEKDRIAVDDTAVVSEQPVYLMLNKPRGVVVTASDEKGRETVYSYLPQNLPWIAPVGRLDQASEGLLLFTNDSEWAARVLAPETHLEKIYHVQIGTVVDAALLERIRRGVKSEGENLQVRNVQVLRQGQRNSWFEITLDEGKNRHIRRICKELGIEVLRLLRIAIGPLTLGDLTKGNTRVLTRSEKQNLDRTLKRRSPTMNH